VHHTIVALMHDRPGALNRAVSLFRRRAFNIDSLAVATTELPGLSRMTVVVQRDEVSQVVRQLERLIDVVAVHDVTHECPVQQEMCLVRLRPRADQLGQLRSYARAFDARIVDASGETVIIALMAAPAQVTTVLERLAPFGIDEITRSGRIAMTAVTNRQASPVTPAERHPEDASSMPYRCQADGAADDEAAA
jgi:acetolactate synthase-1/3 small subunit